MSMEEKDKVYPMYEAVVTYSDGTVKEKMIAVGGGEITVGQMSERIVARNYFPGAKSVELRGSNSSIPEGNLTRQIQKLAAAKRPASSYLTPVPSVKSGFKHVSKGPAGVPDAAIPAEPGVEPHTPEVRIPAADPKKH